MYLSYPLMFLIFFRYSAHGRRAAEEKVTWQRLRPSMVDTESRDLDVSECLQGLKPGDHFEIQWRRTKEFPYGWWFGVVGHLQNCGGEETCSCISDGNKLKTYCSIPIFDICKKLICLLISLKCIY